MTYADVRDQALQALSYGVSSKTISLCNHRFLGYAYEYCTIAGQNGAAFEEERVMVKNEFIHYADLKHAPIKCPTVIVGEKQLIAHEDVYMTNCGRVRGVPDGEFLVRYTPVPIRPMTGEEELGCYSQQADSTVQYVTALEKIYRSERGTPNRRDSFVAAVPHETEPDDLEDGIIYVVRKSEDEDLLKFICPCGCGRVERLRSISNVQIARNAELKLDSSGREYYQVKLNADPARNICRHERKGTTISITFPRRINSKLCGATYEVAENEIHWRLAY
jgi:hypothetical protein